MPVVETRLRVVISDVMIVCVLPREGPPRPPSSFNRPTRAHDDEIERFVRRFRLTTDGRPDADDDDDARRSNTILKLPTPSTKTPLEAFIPAFIPATPCVVRSQRAHEHTHKQTHASTNEEKDGWVTREGDATRLAR